MDRCRLTPRAMDYNHPLAHHVTAVLIDGKEVTLCAAFDQDAGWADVRDPADKARLIRITGKVEVQFDTIPDWWRIEMGWDE